MRLPRQIRLALVLVGLHLGIFLVLRALFIGAFRDPASPVPGDVLARAAWIGTRFDVRLAIFLFLPFAIAAWIPALSPSRSPRVRLAWRVVLTALFGVTTFLYFVDFGHYAWLHERLNAAAVDYVLAWQIAVQTVWESYPVLWIFGGLGVLIAIYAWAIDRVALAPFVRDAGEPRVPGTQLARAIGVVVIVFGVGAWGKASAYPLRWSDAFFSTDPFAAAVGLNPILYVIDSAVDWKSAYDEAATRKHYARMSRLLEVDHPDEKTLTFARHLVPEKRFAKQPNIVIVLMESFAALKVGRFGHTPALDPTPNFDALTRKSVFFTHFFVPRPPTARAIFTTLFSLPDVNPKRSASRNPLIVHQNTIVNSFEGYDKLYLLGGSANWGEIRGMLSANIPGLKLYEEGSYEAIPDDVWGINDLALLE
ncbi:MAG TPA: sulfatase-like hydrolase/transferase, partial [bacterium]|nr:sulfatase-like hydrolase/transferase [bacterium]